MSRSGSSCRIDASSAACATSSASATWRASPAPPEAITGIETASGDRARDLEVVALPRAVGVDRREQDLPRPALLRLARPLDGVAAASRSSPARVRTPPPSVSIATTTACEPSFSASSLISSGRASAARVDRDLVGAGARAARPRRHAADAAADRERDRQLLGDAAHELDERVALLERRLHVEEDELVRAAVGVRGAELDRVADVAQPLEPHALDDAAGRHVEARDQARERHLRHCRSR